MTFDEASGPLDQRRPVEPGMARRRNDGRTAKLTWVRLGAAVVAAVGALLAGAAIADAGTYNVYACDAAPRGVNRSWNGYTSGQRQLGTESLCPSGGQNTAAMVARTRVMPSAHVPYGSYATMRFDPPPGAAVAGIAMNQYVTRAAGTGWRAGVWTGAGQFVGAECGSRYDVNCAGGEGMGSPPRYYGLAPASYVQAAIVCVAASGCDTYGGGGVLNAQSRVGNVTVVVTDGSAPSVAPYGGSLYAGGWLRGTVRGYANWNDNVGISRAYLQRLDANSSAVVADWYNACDFTYARPCSDVNGGWLDLDTRQLEDGWHTIRQGGADAAGNYGWRDTTIAVDNHAPVGPRDLSVVGGQGWRTANGFDVTWTNPPGQPAPIVAARYRLCRDSAPADCTTGRRPGRDISRLEDLRVPASADYSLQVWLEDEAGNEDSTTAPAPVHLRFDGSPPSSSGFALTDPGDPRRLALEAQDIGSGLAAAVIELRPRGGESWRSLATTVDGAGAVRAQVPDDELPDGAYDVRSVLRDVAGNVAVVDRDVTGRPEVVVLPLRTATRVVLSSQGSLARRACRSVRRRWHGRLVRRRVCRVVAGRPGSPLSAREPLPVGFGRAATIQGALETYQGRPVARGVVEVLEGLRGQRELRRVATAFTDGAGRFAYRAAPGASRTIRFVYGGDRLLLPSRSEVRVSVPAVSTLTAGRRSLRNGQPVRFSGRLLGRPIPPGGRTLDLQAHYRGAWRTFATPRTDSRGNWRYVYRFGATAGRVTYRFRALIQREAAYPYEQGYSRTVSVTVRG